MYNCDLCNYMTDRSNDLLKHYKTPKHIRNDYLNSLKILDKHEDNKDNGNETLKVAKKLEKCFQNGTSDTKICHQIDNSVFLGEKNNKKNTKKCVNKSTIMETEINNTDNLDVLESNPKISNFNKNNKCQTIEINLDEYSDNELITTEKIHICECKKIFETRSGLWKHRTKCNVKEHVLQINKLTTEMELIKQTLNKLTEHTLNQNNTNALPTTNFGNLTNSNNQLTNTHSNNLTNNSNNQLTNNNLTKTTKNTQKIVNVYNYITSNYNDAPNITMLEKKDVTKLLKVDKNIKHSMEELLVFNQSKYVLDKFLGEIIINAYKKEDPDEQQFWTSNIQKLTFIVRQILNKKDKTWLHDKNGTCLTKHIIDPLLKEIKKLLQKYVKLLDTDNETKTLNELEKSQAQGMFAVKIIYEINEKELHKKILRYIAPHFQLEQSNLLNN